MKKSIIPINMEKKKQLEVTYDHAKDIVYLQIQPPRPARMNEFEVTNKI